MRILTLESSTSSAKAMLYCLETGKIESITEAYLPECAGEEGLRPDVVFVQTAAVGKRLCAGRPVDLIVLSGVWHSVFLTDRAMKPITNVYSWTTTMAADVCAAKRQDAAYARWYYQKTGCMVNATYPSFKLMQLKNLGYRLSDCMIFGQGSYNTYRLCGERVVTDCMASGTGLLNIHTKRYDEEILADIGITQEQLCAVVPYHQTSPLTRAGAEALGLTAGIPVVAACSDGGLNQVGIGALGEGILSFSVGTSAAIRLTTNRPVLPENPSTWCYLSPLSWMSGAATAGACSCTSWFKENVADASYEELEAICARSGTTPIFLPFLFGERCPGWDENRQGAFVQLKPEHTKYDMYRAVMEGTLFNIYHCYKILRKLNGDIHPKIVLSGGIARSRLWMQICADVFGSPMEIPENEQSSLLGGVILGLLLLGKTEMIPGFFAGNRIVRPDMQRHALYQEKFAQYLYWYDKMK